MICAYCGQEHEGTRRFCSKECEKALSMELGFLRH